MTRCEYDGVFYRVFCVTLLAIAFTFTVILTNVFIDIDGLLSSKEKAKNTEKQDLLEQDLRQDLNDVAFPDRLETFYGDKKTFEEEDNSDYRTKRSLDSPTFQFHLKNPKMKKILTNKLTSLLEELDVEESNIEPSTNKDRTKEKLKEDKSKTFAVSLETKKSAELLGTKTEDHNDMLHLAMHNILLHGIIGHMDLNDVYKKVHTMVQNFEQKSGKNNGKDKDGNLKSDDENMGAEQLQRIDNVENKFFDELTKCDVLHKQIYDETEKKEAVEKPMGKKRKFSPRKSPKTVINTIIDIKSLKNDRTENDTNFRNSKETIKGVIKLIYNGKTVKFNQIDEETTTTIHPEKEIKDHIDQIIKPKTKIQANLLLGSGESHLSENLINQAIANYFDKFPDLSEHFKSIMEEKRKFNLKRLKRDVKVRKDQKKTSEKSKQKQTGKNDDDEFYIEIETHFDSKGVKGERKKKIIRNIVDKIQKAMQADIDSLQDTDKKTKLHIKKRIQNPLDAKKTSVLIDNILIPLNQVLHRELNPISKAVPVEEDIPQVADEFGASWKKTYFGPNFLSRAKSINSAELGELDVDYNNVLRSTGIPQRLQQPLNTDTVEEPLDVNTYSDLGNLKFYIKDIDGTGFSIGFNQYVGDPPDPESIKLFTGLQNLVNTYQQNYDETESMPESTILMDKNLEAVGKEHDLSKRDVYSHAIVRRSAEGQDDYHSNEYKLIFNNNFLPYDSYQEIYEDKNKKVSVSIQKEGHNLSNPSHIKILEKDTKIKKLPYLLGESILKKNLEPAEIFSLASLLERKKRSMNIKKFTKLNANSKLSRFINTNAMTTKRLIIKNKRAKRQVDKIRIIATDSLPNLPTRSDENIFVISSDENNMFGDRVMHTAAEFPEIGETTDKDAEQESNLSPYINYKQHGNLNANILGTRARHNALMSKYPHIFLEEVSRSKEDSSDGLAYLKTIVGNMKLVAKPEVKKRDASSETYDPALADTIPEEVYKALTPKANYKLTMKISPKNISKGENVHSGFKKVHTSINKSVNRNGLLYSSQLNVSEISKIENVNKTEPIYVPETLASPRKTATVSPLVRHIKEQQEKMRLLLRQHTQRIDEQLDHLKKEKQNIESIIVEKEDNKTGGELIDVLLPLNPPRMLHLNKDEARQLITKALMKLHDTPIINSLTTNMTEEPTTLRTTTTSQCPTQKVDLEKVKIMKTIQHNENLTNTILTKIDRNTEILQTFLQKLTNRIQPLTTSKTEEVKLMDNKDTKSIKIDYPTKDWRYLRSPFFSHTMPNLEIQNNGTHVTIPFVYAYQQPYPLPTKTSNPVANVVYQGHIHTNSVHNKNKFDMKEKAKPLHVNETRFFIDGIENDFKVSPILNVNKPYPITFNGTNV